MAGLSEQRANIRNALVGAGIDADSASIIANVLANGVQTLRHEGVIEHDTTPRNMRFVGPDDRKYTLPNLDFKESDPDHRRQRTNPSEDSPPPVPPSTVVTSVAPQQTDAKFRVAHGSMVDATGRGDAVEVNLRKRIAKQKAAGMPLTLMDQSGDSLVGKGMRAQTDDNEGRVRFDIQETEQEVLWNLQFQNLKTRDVVTNVEFLPGKGIQVTYAKVTAWDERNSKTRLIKTTDIPVVTEIRDDFDGFRGIRKIIPSFVDRKAQATYFNTFRIGTFTGDWNLNETKVVRQVWPEPFTDPETNVAQEIDVEVLNLTKRIFASNDSTLYVLYAPRTEDENKNAGDESTALPKLTPTGDPQVPTQATVVCHAIAFQADQAGDAFDILPGRRSQDVRNYEAAGDTNIQALGYVRDPADQRAYLQWIPTVLEDVVTDIEIGLTANGFGITFYRKTVQVLYSQEADPYFLPIEDCGTPIP
jgi:hypothetical protein